MGAFFSVDSPLMRGLSKVADVMLLNLVFLITSLPVVTLGASLTALNFTAMRIATDDCDSVLGDYARSFRRNFRQATIVGAVVVLLTAVLAAWYVVVTSLTFGPVAELVLLAIWYVLAFNFVAMLLFVFPYLATFEGSTREVFRNARLMSWKHPLVTLTALAVIGLCLGVTVFYPQATAYGLFWLAFGFAGIATVNGRLFAHVFNAYIRAAAPASGEK